MSADLKTRAPEARLRRELGLFRERFQALSAILLELQGPRSTQSVLRGAQAVIANTIGADIVWMIDGRNPIPRPMLRSPEPFPAAMNGEVKRCMRSGRMVAANVDDFAVYLLPLQSGAVRWGVLAVRVPDRRTLDAEAVRFLSLASSLLGGAAALWESRTPKTHDVDAIYQGWLSLTALPSKSIALVGELGTGKKTLAERMHDRYVGGTFASVEMTGSDSDEELMATALKRPGVRSLYVHDVLNCAPQARAVLARSLQSSSDTVVFLGTSQLVWPVFPDGLLSRGGLVTIRLPALRERASEVPALVQTGLSERGVKVKISTASRQLLIAHAWPGNYSELAKFIAHAEQALRLEGGQSLTGQLTRHLLDDGEWLSLPKLVDGVEAHVLAEALRRLDGNRAAVARAVGMTPRQVGYKCEKYGLE